MHFKRLFLWRNVFLHCLLVLRCSIAISCLLIKLIGLHFETPSYKDIFWAKSVRFWDHFDDSYAHTCIFGSMTINIQKCEILRSCHGQVISTYFTPFSWCTLLFSSQVRKREEFFPDQKIVGRVVRFQINWEWQQDSVHYLLLTAQSLALSLAKNSKINKETMFSLDVVWDKGGHLGWSIIFAR